MTAIEKKVRAGKMKMLCPSHGRCELSVQAKADISQMLMT